MREEDVKCFRQYVLAGQREQDDEIVRVIGKEKNVVKGEMWFRIRFNDGSILVCHPSNLKRQEN